MSRFASLLAAAALDGIFDHPADFLLVVYDPALSVLCSESSKWLFQSLLSLSRFEQIQ